MERTSPNFLWAFLALRSSHVPIWRRNNESIVDPLTILLSLPLSVPFALFSIYIMGGS